MIERCVCALVVALVACGGKAHAPSSASHADATATICADGQTPGATTALALLEAGGAALARGCPREAMLDAIAAGARPDLGDRAAWVTLLQEEAGRDAHSASTTSAAHAIDPSADFANETWAKTLAISDFDVTEKNLETIATGVRSGAIPAALRESGRVGRLGIRMAPSLACLRVALPAMPGAKFSPQDVRAVIEDFQRELFEKRAAEFLARDPAAALRLRAFGASWACDLGNAARMYDEVARLDPARAADARLSAWEARFVPGGDASLLGLDFDQSEIRRNARDLEFARYGKGLTYQAGVAALAALDVITSGMQSDAATEARAWWLRAVVELRMLDRAADAKVHAARAADLAVRVRRADLLDGARLTGAFAAAQSGDAAESARLFAAVFASLTRRGALGARDYAAGRVLFAVLELQERGRHDDALALALAARSGATGLPIIASVNVHTSVALVYAQQGRVEDAAEAFEGAVAAVRASPDRFAAREPMLRQLSAMIAATDMALGDMSTIMSLGGSQQTPAQAAMRAAYTGDLAPLRQLLARDDVDDSMAWLSMTYMLCAARPGELVAAANDALETQKTLDARANAGAGPIAPLEASQFRTVLPTIGRQLMACAATLEDMELYRAGLALAESSGAQPSDAAYEAAASGRPNDAATIWADLARDAFASKSNLGWFANSEQGGNLFDRAAMALLRANPPRANEALVLLEQSRALDLRVMRTTQRSMEATPALAKVGEIERRIATTGARLRKIVELETAGRGAEALASAHADLEQQLAKLEAERDAAARQLSTTSPDAYRTAALSKPRSVGELQALLADDEVLVYYATGAWSAWAIVVDRKSVSATELAAFDRERLPLLSTRIAAYLQARDEATADARGIARVHRPVSSTPSRLAALRAELYELLVRPLEPRIPAGKRVLIVPDAITQQVAFAELGTTPWIARNSLRLLPGAYLLAERSRADRAGGALVIGDPAFGEKEAGTGSRGAQGGVWEQLPGTRMEAEAVGRLLGAAPIFGADATEEVVKRRMPGASIIHLATHGVANPRRPSSSVVVLSKPASGAREDGFLHAYEVERMELSARLVVLSACETGKGQSRGTEGILALDRAFLVAGAGAVVSSLWAVPDEPTAALMTRFYSMLAAGKPADVALAQAMLHVRADSRWTDPRNWAAFRLVGAGSGVRVR